MNLDIARVNMIKQQLRTCDVVDEEVLALLKNTPREHFVPAVYQAFAFADMNIPIGHGQVMMTPLEEAKIIQALHIQPKETVLEVGTGTGYMTALLAQLAKEVISVEYFADFCQQARIKIKQCHLENKAKILKGDASKGWPTMAPYDVIVMTGSIPILPEDLKSQLKEGGRLFAIVGVEPSMEALVVERSLKTSAGAQQWSVENLFETELPSLINAITKESFVF